MKSPLIRVLLADDHPLVREGIRSTLERCETMTVVGEAGNGQEAVRRTLELQPDIVLMDINMPVMSGLEATLLLRRKAPKIKILALTIHDSREYVLQFIRSGAHGYVLKDTSPDDLIHAIQAVHQGEAFFSPGVARVLVEELEPRKTVRSGLNRLTPREIEVLRQIAQGRTNKEIAGLLDLSVRTVETHRERIMRKLEIRSVAGLTRFALAHELIPAS